MLLNIRTSSSEMIPISDFQYIYDLGKCSKCQMFILLQKTNKLYGVFDDGCCIHEIDVPFLVNTDLMFRLDMVPKELMQDPTLKFFIPADFNWVILPSYYWEMYKEGDIYADYDNDSGLNILYDRTTKLPIQQIQTSKVKFTEDFLMQNFMSQLDGFMARCSTLGQPLTFTNMETNQYIRQAYDNKTAMGRFLCKLNYEGKDICFYIFKGLFSLAKADSLDLDIRFDVYNRGLFMVTFKPKKKKNPLAVNTYGVAFQEKIHCMYINMA